MRQWASIAFNVVAEVLQYHSNETKDATGFFKLRINMQTCKPIYMHSLQMFSFECTVICRN